MRVGVAPVVVRESMAQRVIMAARGLRRVRRGIGSGGVGAPGAAADGTGVKSV